MIHLKNELKNINGEILIYGAHLVALECCRFLVANGKENKIIGFAVTDKDENPDELEGLPVKKIDEYRMCPRRITVVIAMPVKYHDTVEAHAIACGFKNFIKVGLEAMSEIKADQLLIEQLNCPEVSLCLEKSDREGSWLNIRKPEDLDRYYKFPTLFYKSIADVLQATGNLDFKKDYQNVLGDYRNLHKMPKTNIGGSDRKIGSIMQVYMVFSGGDSASIFMDGYEPWIRPLHAGERKDRIGIPCIYDDVGENISDKNHIFAEMTGAYWIWKNVKETDYKGLCHYRRHFVISENEIRALEQNEIDVILTVPRYIPYGARDMFLAETPVKTPVFKAMLQAVWECIPEDEENFAAYMQDCFYYPNNMVIARNDIYDSYCEWIFSILFRMLEIEQSMDYGHENNRHIAYAAELLTSFYFANNRNKYRIAVTEYQFYQ